MKKEVNKLAIVFLFLIIGILSLSFVSAGALDWFDQEITIPSQGLLKLDTGKDNLGNQVFPGFNNLDVKADSIGEYRVYTRFESNGFIEDNWEFVVV